jgi:hypothetical protein
MDMRFSINAETNEPHIFDHGVTEEEVRQVLVRPGDDFEGTRGARIKFGQTLSGRYLKVIFSPDARARQRVRDYRLRSYG